MYDQIADIYLEIFPLNQEFLAFIPEYLGKPGAKVLDLGCGPGDYVDTLSNSGYQATGVDSKLLDRFCSQPRNEEEDILPDKRLSPCNPYLLYPHLDENICKSDNFFISKNFITGNKPHTFFWNTVATAQITPVCNRNSQVINHSPVAVC